MAKLAANLTEDPFKQGLLTDTFPGRMYRGHTSLLIMFLIISMGQNYRRYVESQHPKAYDATGHAHIADVIQEDNEPTPGNCPVRYMQLPLSLSLSLIPPLSYVA